MISMRPLILPAMTQRVHDRSFRFPDNSSARANHGVRVRLLPRNAVGEAPTSRLNVRLNDDSDE
jgi:hypothetical protein